MVIPLLLVSFLTPFGSDFCLLCREALIVEAERKAVVNKDLPRDITERRLKRVPDSDLPKDRGSFAHAMYNGSLSYAAIGCFNLLSPAN